MRQRESAFMISSAIKSLPLLGSLLYLGLWACSRPMQVGAQFNYQAANAGCQIQNLPSQAEDPLTELLKGQARCPEHVFDFHQFLKDSGAQINTTMVANRGYHNPSMGSFSLFETVSGRLNGRALASGSLFFGHFTELKPQGETQLLSHQQTPGNGALMVELIAWDSRAGVFRFYEMIGNGSRGVWFYRGDSLDIRADVARLHRVSSDQPPDFGQRLRCSACHTAGGPIMKELELPHNDWWTAQRPLPLGHAPDLALKDNLSRLSDAKTLAAEVKAGMTRFTQSPAFQNHQRSLQEHLRPLFCAEEINLISDPNVFEPEGDGITQLPTAAFIDPRLLPSSTLKVNTADYQRALQALQSKFPEIARTDADHAWLSPTKAYADIQAIEDLVHRGLINQELVLDVLSVNMLNPVISNVRCNLLKTLPAQASIHANWKPQWINNLTQSTLPGAQELLANLTQSHRNMDFHRQQASKKLQCLAEQSPVVLLNGVALQRQAVFDNEISQNPRGQILEPGFRVIFPEVRLQPSNLQQRCQRDSF